MSQTHYTTAIVRMFLCVLVMVNSTRAQMPENCTLQDGRHCQQMCQTNGSNVTKCLCDGNHELQDDNVTCTPFLQVYDIFPAYGPISGGTKLTISGKNLKRTFVSVSLGPSSTCTILPESTDTNLIISTPEAQSMGAFPNQVLDVVVTQRPFSAKAPVGFTYTPDPIIKAIRPLSTILRGGIQLTVSGSNMKSVAQPKLNIYAIANNSFITKFTTKCVLGDETAFICPSPDLSNIDDFLSNTSFSRAELQFYPGLTLDGVTAYDYNGVFIPRETATKGCEYTAVVVTPTVPGTLIPGTTIPGTLIPGTTTRGRPPGPPVPGPPPPPPPIPTTTLWYPVVCDVCVKLSIVPNPIVHPIDPQELRFRPFRSKFITIKGENLDRGLTKNDYKIFIGSTLCQDLAVYDTELVCRVPEGKPQNDDGTDDILIVVHIGISNSNRIYVGKFIYEGNLWNYSPARSGFIAIIVIVPCVLIVTIVFLVKCSKKSPLGSPLNSEVTPGRMEPQYLHPVRVTSGEEEQNYIHPENSEIS